MDLRAFEYFLTVAREKNVSRAADLLRVSQPTVSRQILELEQDLGKNLFVRAGRTMELTEEGKAFLKTAETMLMLYHQTKNGSSEKTLSGDLYIGSVECDAFGKLAGLMKEFQTIYPEISFHVASGYGAEIQENLQNELLDVGLVIDKGKEAVFQERKFPGEEQWYIAFPEDHAMASRTSVSVEEIGREPLIVPEYDLLLKKPRQGMNQFRIAASYTLLKNAFLMARTGLGNVVVLSDGSLDEKGFSMVPIEGLDKVHYRLIFKERQDVSPAVRAFLDFLQKKLDR